MANCEKCIKSDVCKHYEPGSTSACEHYAEAPKYAHWVNDGFWEYTCSECGEDAPYTIDEYTGGYGALRFDYYHNNLTPYCPGCGAEMKE